MPDLEALRDQLKGWTTELGFQAVGVCDVDLAEHEAYLKRWLARDFHGEMAYMADHGDKRSRPDELLPGTLRVITVRMDYWPPDTDALAALEDPNRAYISRYATGRDYHKLLRSRLKHLGKHLEDAVADTQYRLFVDSAPVLEKALGQKAGLGWIGKHTVLMQKGIGSYFFLGEILTDIPLPVDTPATAHCGTCQRCMDVCPTNAIVAPYQLDARLCISYLTIELRGAIPVELRKPMGNRVFGCDDCQLFCPWNKFAVPTTENDFKPRHGLDSASLLALFQWSEADFDQRTQGSPIRRTGYAGWLRNMAVGLGNAPYSRAIVDALRAKRPDVDDMVGEHIDWALAQHDQHNQGANEQATHG